MHWKRIAFRAGCALYSLAALSACGGGTNGGVNATPTPPAIAPPPPPPPPPPSPPPPTSFDTAEYRRSNGAAQAKAIAAYDKGATGAGVKAGVIDSGIAVSSPEFAGRIDPASADLAGSRGLADEGGHGTAVADILLGAKNDSGIHGVAFGATLLVARTDTPGSCTDPDPDKGCSHDDNAIARGVDLAVANRVRVINISLGGTPANSTLRAAIGRATAAGIIIVFSAGNDSNPQPDPLAQIANDPLARNLVIIAGALDADNATLASFSNLAGNGASHYIGALGQSVRAIDHTGASFLWSGTSFSAPVIAGSVALLAQAFPNLTGAQIVDLLFRTAIDLGTAGVDPVFGNGALDLSRAFGPQGQLILAGSQIPLPETIGTTSAPLGDGGQTGLSAIVLDGYRRAYLTDLSAGLAPPRIQPRLAPALGIGARSRSIANGSTAIALSVTAPSGDLSFERLHLSTYEARHARVLAGSIVRRLGPGTALAFGISRSGLALARDLGQPSRGDFLTGGSAIDSFGFETRARSGMAMRQAIGGLELTASAESGEIRLWGDGPDPQWRRPFRAYGYGALSLGAAKAVGPVLLSARATKMIEHETVLGARFDRAFGEGGARSWFADLEARWTLSPSLKVAAAWRQGRTRLGAGGLRQGSDQLRSNAWSVEAIRAGLFDRTDRVSLRLAQPLRVSSGGFDLTLPTAYDYATETADYSAARFNLAPGGRERDIEIAYARPLWGGWFSANGYMRREPGNVAASHDDLGAAIRFTFGL